MFYKEFYRHLALLAIATFLQPIAGSLFFAEAQAQDFGTPPGEPAPTITAGGGRRGDGRCPNDPKSNGSLEQSLTPLLPRSKFGFTVLANPQFFVYVPKTSAVALELLLLNQQGQGIYQQRVTLTASPSIVSFQLPTKETLEVGKDYKWRVSVLCDLNGDPENDYSEGIVRRIQLKPALMAQLGKASALDRISLYTKFGIWHEALADLAQLRLSQPSSSELKVTWQSLLKSSGLEPLANTPLIK